MKILLTTLNSKYIHSNLALKYLYESAGIYRNLIEIREFTINNDDMSIFMEIMRGDYDVICFAGYIWNISRVIGLIKDIKKADPDVLIVVGGPEVSFDPEEFLDRCPEADIVIEGEGDTVFPELVKSVSEGSLELKPCIIHARPAAENEIHFPYDNTEIDVDKIIYYESSRGCPYRCSFCLSSVSRGVRLLSLERVKRELKFFLEKRVKQVKFVDRTFNIDEERSAQMMDYIIKNDNGITNFHFELCGDRISEEMMQAFEKSRSGLFQIEIGVQSAQKQVIEACNRRVDFEKLKENVLRIEKGENVHVHLDLIAGLPYETFEMFKDSFNQVYKLEPHDLQLGFLKLLKGTKIRNEAEIHGYVYREREPYEIISNKYISGCEILKLKMVECVLELYFNKPGFRNTIRYVLEHSDEEPFDFYMDLAEFYFSNGFQNSQHSKNEQYEILWKYLSIQPYGDKEGLKQLLLYDKIAVAAPSQFSDKEYGNDVHCYLRETLSEMDADLAAKNVIKKVNYMTFSYNVDEFAQKKAQLHKCDEKRLLLFYPEIKNASGQALCKKISYKSGGNDIVK